MANGHSITGVFLLDAFAALTDQFGRIEIRETIWAGLGWAGLGWNLKRTGVALHVRSRNHWESLGLQGTEHTTTFRTSNLYSKIEG